MASALLKLLTFSLVLLSLLGQPLHVQARSKTKTLTEFTEMTLYLPPDLGTRLIFPFNLDGPLAVPELYVQLTNGGSDGVFATHREPNQNSLLVYLTLVPEDGLVPEFLGNLFLSVAGFHLTINLKSSSDLRKHVTDVRFKLNPAKRQYIIDRYLQNNAQTHASDATVEEEANERVWRHMGRLFWQPQQRKSIKERVRSGRLLLEVDRIDIYSQFAILRYQVFGHRKPLQSVRLSHPKGNYPSRNWCRKNDCRLYVADVSIRQGMPLVLKVTVDGQILEAKW